MKEMIKRVREEKGGFTLAELLIVVAILLVLIAIAVPMFTGALGKAEEAVINANARSAKSEALVNYGLELNTNTTQYFWYTDDGTEITGHTDSPDAPENAKYGYKVTLTVGSNKEATAEVETILPAKA